MKEIIVPELAESVTEGTIAQWLKKPGDKIKQGDYLVELETDKVNVELNSDFTGVLKEVLKEAGDVVNVGEVIAIIAEDGDSVVSSETVETKEQEEPKDEIHENETSQQRPLAFPSARKLAREKGYEVSNIQTNDPLGRVRKQDVEVYQQEEKAAAETIVEKSEATSKPEKIIESKEGNKPIERVKMSRRRKTIAKRLVEAQQTAAMLTTYNEIDMTEVIKLRNRRKDKFYEQHGVKLGFMSLFTKAVVAALKQYPAVNAEIQGDEFLLKKFYDIGVAVSTDEGLVVPVVREADRLSFAEIEKEISDLAIKAKANKLKLDDLQGGTFTITNGGVFGSLWSTPILNSPQVGILGMHTIQKRPVAISDDQFENRPMMYIALSYDHRIIDGKEAVSFLVKVKQLLEDPESLFLG
ncbi:2-oxoglutarate dehydrogenase complex dihydrolipoyllysine-residue succinyltransferase [Bacillaceae bacterium IKA-2]|nr:2-oxoglutarate dehydrogenase complex dihydrolipoyllysine-residue succinyltransferase [Bacillaceae bacterium IKA-2]